MQEHIAGPSFFKGVTINAKMRLDHELLSSPEPHILKWLGYIPAILEIINECNCICRHLENDDWPNSHLYLIIQSKDA
ncbi:hypothetical protein CJF42_18380 [Pseudoalteromonas sp. NBT06-2]|nr:hypothetical protein CJF42_18380 [Pseudoalteromonas sp. NBT06-2]